MLQGRGFFLALCFVAVFMQSNAQVRCKIERFTTEDGLSHERGTGIIKDSEGFIWMGSWDGINRFDGRNFIAYKSSPGDMVGLKNDRIDHFVEDKNNNFWLKGVDEFYKFDKSKETFESVSSLIPEIASNDINVKKVFAFHGPEVWLQTRGRGIFMVPDSRSNKSIWLNQNNGRLACDTTYFIYQDKNHHIWIGTKRGIMRLSKEKSDKFKPRLLKTGNKKLSFVDCHEDRTHLYFSTKQGYILVYNKKLQHGKLIRVTSKSLNAIRKSKDSKQIYCSTLSGELIIYDLNNLKSKTLKVASDPILSIYEDKTGLLWLEPRTSGVIQVDPKKNSSIWLEKESVERIDKSSFFKVFEDSSNRVWVCLRGGSFGYYDPISNKFVFQYEGTDGELKEFPNIIYSLFYDPKGVIWLSTNFGIYKVLLQDNVFKYQQVVKNPTDVDGQIRAIWFDEKGRQWIGTKSGKLSVRNADGTVGQITFKNLPKHGWGPVYCGLTDSHGDIWIGTKLHGLFVAQPLDQTGNVYSVKRYLKENSLLSHNDIFSLHEDRPGHIWVGTFGGGLNLAQNIHGRISILGSFEPNLKNFPTGMFQKIRHVNSDPHGNVWVASTDGLLVLRNQKNSNRAIFKHYGKIPGDRTSLGDNDVQFILRDQQGKMWLGTSGGGVSEVFGKPFGRLTFRNYLKEDGLINDFVVSMAQDKRGDIWAATQRGLSRLSAKTHRISNFGANDGLLDASFSEAAALMNKKGQLVFGTFRGYLTFDPDSIGIKSFESNAVLTNLQVNNVDVNVGTVDSLLKLNVNYTQGIQLDYDQNIFSIDFSNLDHRSGSKRPMFYRLTGLNDDWHSDKSRRTATYTNVSPGHYVFEVKSSLDDPDIKTLDVYISPPFWLSWWAYIAYVLMLLFCVKVVFRISKSFLKLQQDIAVQKKMTDLKVEFFTNVSHELRTPLMLISNPVEELERTENFSDKGKLYIQTIKNNAGRMKRFMDQWLELRKAQNGNYHIRASEIEIVKMIERVSTYFLTLQEERGVQLVIESDAEGGYIWGDEEKLDVVLYNVISNAFKFSPQGKKISVNISRRSEELIISIHDQGSGVPDDKLENIFELYYSDGEGNASNKGTGIGLAYSRELIQMHRGKIHAENNKSGGLTVYITLLLGNSHFDQSTLTIGPPSVNHSLMPVSVATYSENSHLDSLSNEFPLVLLVEDNAELRSFLNIQLSSLYRIATAKNGEEGFLLAKKTLPDLILSDVMMPELTGIEMLDLLKNDLTTSHIPVILLTAKSSLESEIEGLNLGADYYISKPFKNELLLSAIENLITGRKKLVENLINRNVVVDLSPSEITITSKDEEFLRKVIDIVEVEMVKTDFNIELVADRLAMGRTTFYNKFKSLTNLTPVEFVREMRLKRGKQLFDHGESNVSVVAYSVGFSNPKYFGTCFKTKYGLTPKEYVRGVNVKHCQGEQESAFSIV